MFHNSRFPISFFSSSYKIGQLQDKIGAFVSITSTNIALEGSGNEIISKITYALFLKSRYI